MCPSWLKGKTFKNIYKKCNTHLEKGECYQYSISWIHVHKKSLVLQFLYTVYSQMLTLMYTTVKELGNILDNFAAGKKLPVKVHKKVT